MTLLAETLHQLLAPLASGGAWAVAAAQGTPTPYIVYQRIPSSVLNVVDGPPPRDNSHVQIDVYALSYTEAATISDAVQDALTAAVSPAFGCMQVASPFDSLEPDTRLYRVMTEYSVWT